MAESTVKAEKSKEGTFGYPISTNIIKQIEVRGDLFGKESKTPQELSYIHGNSPWIVLRSGTDTPVSGGDEGEVSAQDAKNYVLVGGTAAQAEDGTVTMRTGLGGTNAAYTKSSVMGYRPMPGITGVDVKTKDTWGAIMEADIKVQVWAREDLEIIDKLFFKPGMTALLEWGHSVYVDNSGNIHKATLATILDAETFFTPHKFNDIDQLVQSRRVQFCGNYEAVFGYITNFSYTFNDKGGWDCTIKILSKGSVLEGLQIAKPSTEGMSKDDKKEADGDKKKVTSQYHKLFQSFVEKGLKTGQTHERAKVECKDFTDETFSTENWAGKEILRDLEVTLYSTPIRYDRWYEIGIKSVHLISMSIRDFLKVTNWIIAKSGVQFDLESENEYVTSGYHFSINPYIANVPHIPSAPFNLEYIRGSYNDLMFKDVSTYDDVKIEGFYKILNIPISINYILDTIEKIVDTETENYSVFDMLNSLLAGMQKSFGNINNFGLHQNHITGLWSIVDRQNPKMWTEGSGGPGQICISGLKTTVQKLTVNSAVSPSIANEMAIAAQAPVRTEDEGKSEASPSIVNWNEGCKNRHEISSDTTKENKKTEETTTEELIEDLGIYYIRKDYEDFLKKAEDFYRVFNYNSSAKTEAEEVGNFTNDRYTALQLQAESIFKRIVGKESKSEITVGSLCMGVIPVKVELQMLGISRFVIGTSFKVTPGILLPKYDSWGYIVTGVDHSISPTSWTTHIRSQYFPILKKKSTTLGYSTSGLLNGEVRETYEVIDHEPYFYIDKSIEEKKKYLGIKTDSMTGYDVLNAGYLETFAVNTLNGTMTVTASRAVKSDLICIFDEIKAKGFDVKGLAGWRGKSSTSTGNSMHCWGAAVDINRLFGNPWFKVKTPTGYQNYRIPKVGPEPKHMAHEPGDKYDYGAIPTGGYVRTQCIWSFNHPVVRIFLAHGWGWGGAYGDTMHFSLFDGH